MTHELSREQQQLLGILGTGMASDALLDRFDQRGTLEGGCSAPQDNCWVNYNRKAVWLEDHSEAAQTAGSASDDGGRVLPLTRPRVMVTVTWTRAAAHGTRLPRELRAELGALRRAELDEDRSWWEFSQERGGWPWRQRYATDQEHQIAEADWDTEYTGHLAALRELRVSQRAAIERALPLLVDDEPVDLLELLEQPPLTASRSEMAGPARPAALQSEALRGAATAPAAAEEGLFPFPAPARPSPNR